MQGEARELFASGAHFQNTVVVVVAREDLLPAFELSIGTSNSVPFLDLPYAHDKKQVQRLRNYRRNEAALDKFVAWHCAERGRDPTDMLTSRMLQRNRALYQVSIARVGNLRTLDIHGDVDSTSCRQWVQLLTCLRGYRGCRRLGHLLCARGAACESGSAGARSGYSNDAGKAQTKEEAAVAFEVCTKVKNGLNSGNTAAVD